MKRLPTKPPLTPRRLVTPRGLVTPRRLVTKG